MADLVWYLGLEALVAEIINKLELVYGIVASFDILMQIIYKLQQGKTEKVMLYVTQLEGVLNEVQQDYSKKLGVSKVQKHLRDGLFHGLCKQLCDSMCYLYSGMRIMYPQLMTAAHKAESEQEDWPREEVWVRLAQLEGKDGIVSLREQIMQLWVAA